MPPPVIKKPAPPPKPQGPQLSRAEWAKREPVRQLLENMLARQAALCEAQRTAILRNCLAGPSSFERAAEIAPIHPNAVFMQRMQDSAFREVWRISNLLLKLHRQAPPPDNHENCPESAYEGDTPAPPFRSDFDPEGGSIDAVTEPAVEPAQAEAEQSFPPTQSEVTPTSQSPCPNAKVARAASTCRIRTFKNVTLPDTRQKTREKDVKKPTSQSARAGARVSPIVSPCRIQPFRNATSVDAHRKSRKKDVKMKVYPDNSNRISKASQGTPKGVVFAGNGSPPA